jgi:phosphatidylethanolamine-binding protein (PEBP) family uncharacterized protein
MLLRGSICAVAVTLAALCGSNVAHAQGAFTLTSPDFKDGTPLAVKNAGNNKSNPNCVGENISPAFAWANPPEGTKSYALMMFDPEGRPPSGVSHWVAYGIPVSVTGFAEGEVSKPSDKYIGGLGTAKLSLHAGRCAASLHLHADRNRSGPEGAAARADAQRTDHGARGPRQERDRFDRHLHQAVNISRCRPGD